MGVPQNDKLAVWEKGTSMNIPSINGWFFQGVPPFMDPPHMTGFFCSAYDFLASPPKKTETWLLGGCSYHLGRRCSKEPWSTYSRRGVQKKKIRLWADASGATSRWWVSFRGPAAKWPLFQWKYWETDHLPVESGVCRVPHFQTSHSSMGSKNDPNLGRLQVGLLR